LAVSVIPAPLVEPGGAFSPHDAATSATADKTSVVQILMGVISCDFLKREVYQPRVAKARPPGAADN
jgi:hypothetical protein